MNIGIVRSNIFKEGTISLSREDETENNFKTIIANSLFTNKISLHINGDNLRNAQYIYMNMNKFKDRILGKYNDSLVNNLQWFYIIEYDQYITVDFSRMMNINELNINIFNILINEDIAVITGFIENINITETRENIYKRNVVITGIICKKCGKPTVIQQEVQMRSGDEGGSLVEDCSSCGYRSLKWS